MAERELCAKVKGKLVGDPFIAKLHKHAGSFSSLNKSESSMKRVFQQCGVFARPNDNKAAPLAWLLHQALEFLTLTRTSATPRPSRLPSHPHLSGQKFLRRRQGPLLFWWVHLTLLPLQVTFLRALFLRTWHLITTDSWVLHTICGFAIDFTTDLVQTRSPTAHLGQGLHDLNRCGA